MRRILAIFAIYKYIKIFEEDQDTFTDNNNLFDLIILLLAYNINC